MSDQLSDLPDDVREAIQPEIDEPVALLAAIGVQIAAKREEAKGARSQTGIESTWKECEESYLGIDDANRHEFNEARWAKPMSMDGPVTTGRRPKNTDYRSTVFLRLTSRYVGRRGCQDDRDPAAGRRGCVQLLGNAGSRADRGDRGR